MTHPTRPRWKDGTVAKLADIEAFLRAFGYDSAAEYERTHPRGAHFPGEDNERR